MKMLFVCLGNICRSPMAEGIMRHLAPADYIIDSAGTSNYHIGQPPDQRMIDTAKSFGIDLSSLRARSFTEEDFDHFDAIYVMDHSNYKNVIKLANTDQQRRKVHYALPQQHEVPDPYFGGKDGFIEVYNLLYGACQTIIDDIKKR